LLLQLWDIRETREDPIISLPASEVMASVYALSTNAAGTVLAGGTPERVVRTWDPRSGKRIASLIGHTDNIRSLVVSDDGRYLLSASSDASIRLWSLGEQRCLHTFTHHSESVWSLHSSHPTLDVFYSGDRMGYVCKVDWERCAEPAEGECVVLFKDSGEGSKTGVPRARKDNMGIHKIIAQDDAYVWTAGGSSSVARWNDVPSRMSREALYPISSTVGNSSSQALLGAPPRATDSPAPPAPSLTSALKSAGAAQGSPSAASVSFAHKSMDSPGLRFQVPSHLAGSNLRAASGSRHRHTLSSASQATSTDVHELAGASQHHPAATLYGIPFDSLVSLAPPASESYAAVTGLSSMVSRDPDSGGATSRFSSQFRSTPPFSSPSFDITQHMSPASPIPASLLSETTRPKSTRSASIRFAPEQEPLPRDSLAREASNEAAVVDDEEAAEDAAIEARQAYEERDAAPDAIPLYSAPADVIEGTHGLIRTSMLNDRRHVLTIDTAGVVAVWDIVKGACLGVFRTQDVVTAARDAGDIEFRDPNSDEVAPADALNLVRERIEGEAATLLWCTADVRGGLLSVHLEELRAFDAEIYLDDCDFVPQAFAKEDQRINMGKLVLRNLFDTFVSMEYKLRSGPSPPMRPGQLALDHPKLLHSPPSQISIPNGRTFRDLQRTPGMTIALAEPPKTPALLPAGAAPLTPSASRGLASLTSRTAAGSSGAGAPGSPGDYFSLPNQSGAAQPSTPTNVTTPGATSPAITTAAAPTSGGLMSRLRIGKNRKGDKNADVSASKADEKPEVAIVAVSASRWAARAATLTPVRAQPVEDKNAALRQLLSQPVQPASASEIPTYSFLADTTILVEQAPEPGSWQAQYRGLVRTVAQDAGALEAAAPLWLLDFLLHNRGPTRDPSKISFTLAPWIAPELRGRADGFGGYGNISGSTPVPLPELPSG
jgi:WD repeat-containing protein 48